MPLPFGRLSSTLHYGTTTLGKFSAVVELVSQSFYLFKFYLPTSSNHVFPFTPLVFYSTSLSSFFSLLQSLLWRSQRSTHPPHWRMSSVKSSRHGGRPGLEYTLVGAWLLFNTLGGLCGHRWASRSLYSVLVVQKSILLVSKVNNS